MYKDCSVKGESGFQYNILYFARAFNKTNCKYCTVSVGPEEYQAEYLQCIPEV